MSPFLNLSSDWKMHNYSRRQESLADAKVSARQQCVLWRPATTKSIANRPCVISFNINSNHGRIELENHSIAITIASIAEEYTLLKSTFWGYNDNRVYHHSFSRFASQICKIKRNSEKFQTCSSSRSSKSLTLVPTKADVQLPVSH